MRALILGLILIGQAAMGQAWTVNGNAVKSIRQNLNLNDVAYILTGFDDPSMTAIRAPKGSLYMQLGDSGGKLWIKLDASTIPTTNWGLIGGASLGTVTSVALALPDIFGVSGSPITSNGTITATLSSQGGNLVFASPDSLSGTPVFRSLVSNDIPNLSAAKITSGKGTLSTSTTGVTVTGGTNALFSSASVDVQNADSTHTGLLTSGDWMNFDSAYVATNAATSANTASTIVKRDASGNFAGGAILMTQLQIKDSGSSFFNAFQSPSLSGSTTYTLPAMDGTTGQLLSTNGSGTLSWATSSSGANTALSNLSAVAINADLLPGTSGVPALGSFAKKFSALHMQGAANIYGDNPVRIYNSANDTYIGLQAPSSFTGGTYTIRFPQAQGTSGQTLSNDGSGNLSWASRANTALSNLDTNTSINGNLIPSSTQLLGSSSLPWTSLSVSDIELTKQSTTPVDISLNGNSGFTFGAATNVNGYVDSVYPWDMAIFSDDDGTADSTPTGSFVIKTGDKSAGTGNSGSLYLQIGSSSGGTHGKIYLKDGSEGTAGQVWTSTGTQGEGAWQPLSVTGIPFDFGDASDGDIDLDGVNTYPWAILSGSTYTAFRSVYAHNLIVRSGETFYNGANSLWGTGSLTVEATGTISADGGDGGNASVFTGGTAGQLSAYSVSPPYSSDLQVGAPGNAGLPGDQVGNGEDGGTGNLAGPCAVSGTSGSGGTGGAGSLGTGGVSGSGVDCSSIVSVRHLITNLLVGAGTAQILTGGSGGGTGGAGGGDGVNFGGASGGSGAGGGDIFLAFDTLNNLGTITAKGGNGGNGGTPSAGNAGGGAGSGGGSGGLIYIVNRITTSTGTVNVNKGTHGNGAPGVGTGTSGANGTDGSPGLFLHFQTSTGTWL